MFQKTKKQIEATELLKKKQRMFCLKVVQGLEKASCCVML